MSEEDEKPNKLLELLDEWNLVHERVAEFALIAIVWRAIKSYLKIDDYDDRK